MVIFSNNYDQGNTVHVRDEKFTDFVSLPPGDCGGGTQLVHDPQIVDGSRFNEHFATVPLSDSR